MSDVLTETIGEVLVGTRLWRVTLCHGLIQFWTDDTSDTINPRYVLSADIPVEALELAAVGVRKFAQVSGGSFAADTGDKTLKSSPRLEALTTTSR
jgi:preprotein translocase subunit Sec61beta